MEQEQICEILKQIIPELQHKIRTELKQEYDHRIAQIEIYYQTCLSQSRERQKQLQKQVSINRMNARETKDTEALCKRVAMLESQRKNWNKLEKQYQATIEQLSALIPALPSRTGSVIEAGSPIQQSLAYETASDYGYNSTSIVHPPPKSSLSTSIIPMEGLPFRKDKARDKKIIDVDDNVNSLSEISENVLSKYVGGIKNNNQAKQHYRSVLSPPKEEQSEERKKIFWDQTKKKQLLSLIKLN